MFLKVLGWVAFIGSIGTGIALLIFSLAGEDISSGTYIRAAIILPIVLIYGLYQIRKSQK